MVISFKGVSIKKGKHVFKYNIEEIKMSSDMKTTVSVTLEDTNLDETMSLEELVSKCSAIAKTEYNNR